MRVLVIGARGMLGTDLVALAPAGTELHSVGLAELDIRDAAAGERMLDAVEPELVINASAYTAVDRAEQERDAAFAVNAHAVGALGRACAARDVAVVHFSTDYVFAGDGARPYRETDGVSPVNAYGESKLAGERLLMESGVGWLIVRTQWLFGANGKSFPRTMWQRATSRQPTRVVNDQTGSPTFTVDLAIAVWKLVAARARGLYHVTNSGSTTWFDFAALVFAAAEARELLSPCATADYPTPARRPHCSVLDTAAVRRDFGIELPAWHDAANRFIGLLAQETHNLHP